MEKSFLYKYQPLWLNEFDLEEDLNILLKTLLEMNVLNILFIGESGSGKTSLINAIIHEYYINNLKEQGITYYRVDVKTFCQTPSGIPGKKKILVVDDIDFINEQSQQVFRNYIDKYSHNVHFIGSCINTQKVIDSLQSRLTIIKKRNLPENKLVKIIGKICKLEKISITSEVSDFIIWKNSNYWIKKLPLNWQIKCVPISLFLNLINTPPFVKRRKICRRPWR